MRARWDESTKRWEASSGHGKSRKWFRSRIEGPEGESKVNESLRLHEDGPEPLRKGSLAEFIEIDFWPRQKFNSKNTRIKYASVIENHFVELCSMQLNSIRLGVLQSTVNGWCKYDDKVNPDYCTNAKTVRTNYGLLKQMLHLAKLMQKIQNSDYELVALPEVPKKAKAVLSLTDGDLLIEAAKGTTMEGLIWAAFHFGLRPNEVYGMKVPHVVIGKESAVVTVQSNRQIWGESDALKNKKRGETRELTVPRWMGEKLLSFAPEGALYIFHTQLGKPVSTTFMAKRIAELCEKAGVPKINYKNLRHSCATILSNQGVPVAVIRDILGHTTEEMTLEYIQKQQQQVLAAFSGRVSGVGQ